MHANIVKSPLVSHQFASDMKELTRERSHIHASVVKSLLVSYQTVGNMN